AKDPRPVRGAIADVCDRPEVSPAASQCLDAVRASATDAGAGGPPEVDILGVSIEESPDTVVFVLELASVDPSFARVLPNVGGALEYGLCWDRGDRTCNVDYSEGSDSSWPGSVYTIFLMTDGGPVTTWNSLWYEDPACGGDELCQVGIGLALVEGTPGEVRWSVPRHLLLDAEAGGTIEGLLGYIYYNPEPDDPDVGFRYGFFPEDSYDPNDLGALADVTPDGEPFTFETPAAPAPLPRPGPHELPDMPDEPGGSLETDILSVTLAEDARDLVFSILLAEVRADPSDHELTFYSGLRYGAQVTFRRAVVDGEEEVTGLVCPPSDCDRAVALTPMFEVVPGTPGHVNVTFSRLDLLAPARGAWLAEVVATASAFEVQAETPGEAGARLGRMLAYDVHVAPVPPPLAFDTAGTAASAAAVAGGVSDELDDVAPEAGPSPASRSNYDVRRVEAAALEPGVIGLTLALDALRPQEAPAGYDAFVYAVGVRTDRADLMAYFLKPRGAPGEAYCAEDTLIFSEEAVNPSSAIGEAIEYRANAATASSAPRGETGGGALTFLLPAQCLGIAPEEALAVREMAGAAFLVKTLPGGETVLRPVDRSPSSEPFVVEALTVPVVPPTFWEAPFGYENGWDMLGAGLAGLTVLFAGVLFLRRRRQLQNYVKAISEAEARHAEDPATRAAALVSLRAKLHRDLVRHRVSDAHYSIILERLRSRITSARLMSVGERIYDVPTNLALRIERLLDDGRLTAEEHRAILPALTKANIPEETLAVLRARLSSWASEDAKDAV
ncbi:MAG: hypothetical protein ACT4PT_07190, partial [Methanobacteriota archaeon]